ncbi:hypothetical protein BH20ACI2_BH20ACI2_09120 [soil metagenome]
MGLDINGTKFLLYARARGVSFDEIAIIGRQEMLVEISDLENNLRQFDLAFSHAEVHEILNESGGYAEAFLRALGAKNIVSFDASTYENASVVHDFNAPISDGFKNRFSTVLDGGTLEHIFNFPTAIRNCMEMVAEGGHFLAITPTNNHSGHGFYQFSPELFFRIFSEQNGFELQHLIIFEETTNSPWYDVADPQTVKERVALANEYPTMLLIIARKIRTAEIFGTMPQQSDYLTVWNAGELSEPLRPASAGKQVSMIRRIPAAIVRRIRLRINKTWGTLNTRPNHFKKIRLP